MRSLTLVCCSLKVVLISWRRLEGGRGEGDKGEHVQASTAVGGRLTRGCIAGKMGEEDERRVEIRGEDVLEGPLVVDI